jgi:hypothetical protein
MTKIEMTYEEIVDSMREELKLRLGVPQLGSNFEALIGSISAGVYSQMQALALMMVRGMYETDAELRSRHLQHLLPDGKQSSQNGERTRNVSTIELSRQGLAPCGHKGKAIIGNYVQCSEGCDN